MSVFEQIINGTLPSNKIYENETVLAIHDKDPQSPVHILVLPKKKCKNIEDADSQTISDLFNAIKEITNKMGLNKSGYRVIINNGEDAHQNIDYLHIHILGGKKLSKTIHYDYTHTM